jgi:hypothetical protein
MTPALRTKPRAATTDVLPALRTLMVGLFLAIQAFLFLHQLEHSLRPDLAGPPDGCVLCQATANLLPAPEPAVVTVPVTVVHVAVVSATAQTALSRAFVAAFRSRAPPIVTAA